MPEQPLVRPEHMLGHRGLVPGKTVFSAAVLCFRDWDCSRLALRSLGARRARRRYLSFVESTERPFGVWSCHLAGERVAVVPCLIWGGPVTAVVVEELAALGVRYAVGLGACGSLRPELQPGTIACAERAFVSCGTSQQYTNDREVAADTDMLRVACDLAARDGVEQAVGTAWTTDALYRELPSRIRAWRRKGADWTNMETASFYAVARHTGVRALHLGPVSDYIGGQEWDTWYRDLSAQDEVTIALCREVLERMLATTR